MLYLGSFRKIVGTIQLLFKVRKIFIHFIINFFLLLFNKKKLETLNFQKCTFTTLLVFRKKNFLLLF